MITIVKLFLLKWPRVSLCVWILTSICLTIVVCPKKPSDYEAIFDPVNNNHVIVIRKNKFYIVDTFHNGQQLSTNELEQQFQRIINQAGSSKGLPIGVLTSDNRDKWTEVIGLEKKMWGN